MLKHPSVLNNDSWGAHLNFEGYFSSPPSCPSWLTLLQQQDWPRRGIIVWDADLRIVAYLYAGYALEILEHLQGNDAWKTKDLVIGSPAFQFSTSSAVNSSPKIGGTWIVETISQFINPPRFVMPRQNRSGPGSERANLKHSIRQDSG